MFLVATPLVAGGGLKAFADTAIKPGHTRFVTGREIILSAVSTAETKTALTSQMSKMEAQMSKLKPDAWLKKITAPMKQDTWTREIRLSETPISDEVLNYCNDFIGYSLLPRMKRLPKRYKKVVIKASDFNGTVIGTCDYARDAEHILVSAKTGKPTRPALDFKELKLWNGGVVSISQLATINRFDVNKLVREYLLVVPYSTWGSRRLSRTVEAAANYLYARDGDDYLIAFVIAEKADPPTSYVPSGLSLIAVKDFYGEIIQMLQIKLTFGRVVMVEGYKRPPAMVQILIQNSTLAQYLANDNLNAYLADGLFRDSSIYFHAVGEYAAEQFDVNRVIIMSYARVKKNNMRISMPVVFKKENGSWKITNRPKK